MAPDRPESGVVARVHDFCEGPTTTTSDNNITEQVVVITTPSNESNDPVVTQLEFIEETTAFDNNEIVIEEEEVPMIKEDDELQKKQEKPTRQSDDDLTSLTWLQQQNLLKSLDIRNQPTTVIDATTESVIETEITKKGKEEDDNEDNDDDDDDIPKEVTMSDDVSLDVSENTDSISSFDDNHSHESSGINYNPNDSGVILNNDENSSPLSKNSQVIMENANLLTAANNQQLDSENSIFDNGSNNNNNNNNTNAKNNFNLAVYRSNKHPSHIPYDPQLHKNCKPPYSFSSLIFMSIEDSPNKALPVKEIYAWILNQFPYFRNAPIGWKNSVRHNLSLNKCFRKVEKSPHLGKGSLWMVDAHYRPNLLQALNRTPCAPTSTINTNSSDKVIQNNFVNTDNSCNNNKNTNNNNNNNINNNNNKPLAPGTRLPDPILFPYLSKRLASSSTIDGNATNDVIDRDVDAAAVAMLSFKNGSTNACTNKNTSFLSNLPKVEWVIRPQTERKKKTIEKKPQVILRNLNEDHTYSLVTASLRVERRDINNDNDERRKLAEGADALLNLAGVTTSLVFDPLEPNENDIARFREEEEEEDEIGPDYKHLYGNNINVSNVLPGSDPLDIRSIKRQSTGSNSDGTTNKRRKRLWKNNWTENGRYAKQVKG